MLRLPADARDDLIEELAENARDRARLDATEPVSPAAAVKAHERRLSLNRWEAALRAQLEEIEAGPCS